MEGETEKNSTPEAGVPPKLDLKQAVAAQNQPQKKATTRIDMAAAAMISEEKSKTTRINLGSFGVDPASAPKTIKIQRPSEASTIKINRPGAAPVVPLTPAPPPLAPAQAKRQTSRISLQEALTPQAEAQASAASAQTMVETPVPSGGPKTIRIKRPGDTSAEAAVSPSQAAATPAGEPGLEAGPPTQRKTIKLRRPGAGAEGESTVHHAVLPKSAADFAAAQAAGPQVDTDEPGPLFGILSIAATLVCSVLIYLLCVQALPNLGLTWSGQVPTLH